MQKTETLSQTLYQKIGQAMGWATVGNELQIRNMTRAEVDELVE